MSIHKPTLEKSIFKATFLILIAHQLFKLAGLIQAKAMGHYLPQDAFDVVYVFAFENCIYLLFLIGEEVLGPAFLPVFMRELNVKSEKSAWVVANTLLTLQFFALVLLACALCFFPGAAVSFLTQWSPNSSPDKYKMAQDSVRALAPALIGLSLGSTTYVLLNSYKRFFLAAFGDAVWKFCVVFFLLAGAIFSHDSSKMLVWGLLAGSICKLLTHLFGLRDKLRNFRPALNLSHPAIKTLCLLALPLLLGILVAKMRDQVNHVYLLSSLDRSGLMQANSMGRKLQGALLYLVPYTLSIAAFPFFCELVSKEDAAGLGRLVTRFGRMLLSLFAPVAFFVAVAAVPLTALVFGGGYFDDVAVRRTSVALIFYTFALPAAAIETLVMQAFFANRRMITVTLIGIVFSTLSMIVSWLGIRFYGGRDLVVLAFIAGGFTLSRVLKCFTLVEMLKKNAPVFPFVETLVFLARVSLAAAVAALGAWLSLQAGLMAGVGGKVGEALRLAMAGGVFGLLYLAAAYGLRIGEMHEVFCLVRNKLRKQA